MAFSLTVTTPGLKPSFFAVNTYSLYQPNLSVTTASNGVTPKGVTLSVSPQPRHPLHVTDAPGGTESNFTAVEHPVKAIKKPMIKNQ